MKIRVQLDNLKTIFGRVSKACAKDDPRKVICGVNLEIENGTIIATALNGYVLAQYSCNCVPENEQDEKTVLTVLPDKLAKFNPVTPVELSDEIPGFLQISDGQQKQLMRLIDGQFVEWRKITHEPEGDPDPQAIRRVCFTADYLKIVCEIAGKGEANLRMKIGKGTQGIWCASGDLRMLILPARCTTDELWQF